MLDNPLAIEPSQESTIAVAPGKALQLGNEPAADVLERAKGLAPQYLDDDVDFLISHPTKLASSHKTHLFSSLRLPWRNVIELQWLTCLPPEEADAVVGPVASLGRASNEPQTAAASHGGSRISKMGYMGGMRGIGSIAKRTPSTEWILGALVDNPWKADKMRSIGVVLKERRAGFD